MRKPKIKIARTKRIATIAAEVLVVLALIWIAPYFTDISLAGSGEQDKEKAVIVTPDGYEVEVEFEDEEGILNATTNLTAFTAYTQNFDTLGAANGNTYAANTIPEGWRYVVANESGTATYMADNGQASSILVYSYGARTGPTSTDRALGMLDKEANTSVNFGHRVGVLFTNNTGRAIKALKITYTAERWRSEANTDGLTFAYNPNSNGNINANTSNTGGTSNWVNVANLAANFNGGSVGAVNGNNPGNRATISHTITDLSIANGTPFGLRWVGNLAASGKQQGIGIDDVSVRPVPVIPETSLLTNPPSQSTSTSATFTFSSDDDDATFECSVTLGSNPDSYSACTSGTPLTLASDGAWTFKVRAKSDTGTDGSPSTYSWTVDSTAPDTSFTSTPGSFSGSSASFAFTTSDGGGSGVASIQCRLNSASFANCTSPVDLTGLTAGSNTFEVRATDAFGNVETTVASHTWTVDTTAPGAPTIDTNPASATNVITAGFTFSGGADNVGGSGFGKYQCKLDAGTYADCISPQNLSGLSEGSHTFYVRSVDAVGNAGVAAEYTWLVDLTAPGTPSIDTKPAAWTTSTSASFTFSGGADNLNGSGFAKYECRRELEPYADCSSPESFSNLLEGVYSFSVRSVDNAGNAGTAAVFEWQVDTTAPAVPNIDTKPETFSGSASASFTFSGGDDSITGSGRSFYECKIDQEIFASCTSGSFTGLDEGSHTFYVRSVDRAGNSSDAASYTWTVDLTGPSAPTIGTKPSANTNLTSASFTFTGGTDNTGGSGVAKYECKLDTGSYSDCVSGAEFTVSEGSRTFSVRAVDAVDNAGEAAEYTWLVDLTEPGTPSIDTNPDAETNSTTASFTFSGGADSLNGSGLSNYECKIDDGEYAECDSPESFDKLLEGSHTFYVRSVDNAGNKGTAATYTWLIDLTTPEIVLSGPIGFTNNPNVSFTFSATDDNLAPGFQCRFNDAEFSSCSSVFSPKSLDDGEYTFEVRAFDDAGNEKVESLSFTVDTIAPTIGEVPTPDTVPNETETKILVAVGDVNPLDTVRLYYDQVFVVNGNGQLDRSSVVSYTTCTLAPVDMGMGESTDPFYECPIPAVEGPAYLTFYVEAVDVAGNSSNEPSPSVPNAVAVRGPNGESAPLPPGPFSNVTIDGDLEIGGDVEILGVLTVSGAVTITGGKIILGCDATVDQVNSSSFIIGAIEKQFCGATQFTYPIGVNEPGVNSNGDLDGGMGGPSGIYAPATVTIESASPGSSLTIQAFAGRMGGSAPTHNADVYWTTIEEGSVTADLRFGWSAAGEIGNRALYSALRRSSGVTEVVAGGLVDTENPEVTFLGVTEFNTSSVPPATLESGLLPPAPSVPYEWTAALIGTTAGSSELSGRVLSHLGQGLKDVTVTVMGGTLSAPLVVRTNQFGIYRFSGLESGETYVLTVSSQRHSFGLPVRVVYLADSLTSEEFVADPK